MLVVFEDLQWIDPTSRELLDLMIERLEGRPILLIATFRPEFLPSWTGLPQVTALSLSRLSRRSAGVLVHTLAGAEAVLPDDVADAIVERSDGVPLFLEELTKAVLEETAAAGRPVSVPVPKAVVPATLHASLLGRLDGLGPAPKEVAQIGAAIGREFSFELLTAAAGHDDPRLQAAIERLVEAGLVFQRGTPPHARYLFKHALVQEVAYGTLLRAPRQQLHARIADALLRDQVGRGAVPEVIAHHLQSAGRSVEAISYWREAGERAVSRAANREGIEHFRRALSLIEGRPETAEGLRTELAVLSQLGPALMSVHGWSAPEAGETVERATKIGRRLESSADLAPSIANLAVFNIYRCRLDQAEEASAELFRIARELGDPEIMLQAHHCAWPVQFHRGRFAQALEHADTGLGLYEEDRYAHHRHIYFGHDPAVCALALGAAAQRVLGYPAQRDATPRRGHSPGAALTGPAVSGTLEVSRMRFFAGNGRGRPGGTRSCHRVAGAEREIWILPVPRVRADVLRLGVGCFGRNCSGIAQVAGGFGILRQQGAQIQLTMGHCMMAEAHLMARYYREGLEHASQGLDAAKTSDQSYLSRIHHVHAELLLHLHGSRDEAVEASLRRAIMVARRQGAKGWELPAATSLARLWFDRGRRDEARELLAPVYEWFTEGLDTPDLKAAKALLQAAAA